MAEREDESAQESPAPAPPRPVDASMDLLKQIIDEPIDPDYAVLAKRREGSSRRRWMLTVTLVALGAMIAIAGVQNLRAAPVAATERQELIERIDEVAQRQDELRERTAEQSDEVRRLRSSILNGTEADRELTAELERLDLLAATVPVTGPGMVIEVDDAATDDPKGRVMDIDLQQLVNGLWASGAEAIAINGHRISSLTAIRGAGDAITVNYRSLTRPYRVEVIGDPDSLPSRYAESAGGIWWNGLARNYGMRHVVSTADELTLGADSGVVLRHARKGK
ncbi:DUF881 domain-containing protein [Propionibacteriaceae bacterium Y2011]|uniref:DUF881 domain-containing protein n=1 Tax=Microlunatus sp. Y2014 TaxID=3418488 RepID=UPI003B4CA137